MAISRFSRLTLLFPLLLPGPARAEDPAVIHLKTPPGQMKYDRPVITATPGATVKLVFENLDEMPHNFVLCRPLPDKNDRGLEVAQLAWELGAAGMEKGWIPESPRVLAHSGLVNAHETRELILTVPEEPGVYPYVCTFPGHAMAMNGELRVLREGPSFSSLNYRLYSGDWTSLPDFDSLTPLREGVIPGKKLTVELEGMANHFGVRYDGVLEVPSDGPYQFFLASDDGSEIMVDGRSILKNDGIHPASSVRTRRLRFKKGPHQVRVNYFEGAGEEQLYLAWAGADFSETPLSSWIHPSREDRPEVSAREDEFTGIPLGPENGEAVIFRNFIAGGSPRGIAVGYPNGVNLCFDANQMAPALFWQGAFIDAKRHWTGRGGGPQAPLGYNSFAPAPDSPGLAALPREDSPWPPKRKRADNLRFRGYHLDAKRFPTFMYDLGSVSVSESYQPEGSQAENNLRVTRTFHFHAPQPVAGLHVRAAAGALTAVGDAWKADGFRITSVTGSPVLRGTDLLVPVVFTGDTATVAVTYHWNP